MTDVKSSYEMVLKLIEGFQAHRRVYMASSYQEQELRSDFLNKFYNCLGWDVDHVLQRNPFEQEVKVERSVRDKQSKRRADYAFFITPNFRDPKFYVEAKRPSVELATKDNYFQAIRYGWNSQTPIVVLTNFRETHLIDCRYKPDVDTALNHLLKCYTLEDIQDAEKFAELYYLLSRAAIATGSLEKYAAQLPKKRGKAVQLGLFKGGYQRMDRSFLVDLDDYRQLLARGFKRADPALDGRILTEITQRVLDRLIFIRFLEDKLIEPHYLVASFGARGSSWADFVSECRRLNAVYNGIVFKPHPLMDTPHFLVDDTSFADVCERLAHVNSPYDFNFIPIHILGNIYERFLGNVIVTTPLGARLEEKPEVRKVGGVYYTPEYIVRHLVAHTVGRCVAGKSPQQMSTLRFCDVACGSGSFLLGIYEYLLDEHSRWYMANPERARNDGCILHEDGSYHLSLSQRRAILINNVFGVDVDPQAVEVAQLSLYLKLLEEETTASARAHQLEIRETILPSLNRNIVCGNSLIETDILEASVFDRDEERRVKPMDLKGQFSKIMMEGGFDAVLGNPPYVRPHNIPKPDKEYLWQRYPAFKAKADLYTCFIQRPSEILKPGGYLAYIVSRGWLVLDSFDVLRKHILDTYKIVWLVELSSHVFEDAQVETMAFVFQRESRRSARDQSRIEVEEYRNSDLSIEFQKLRTIPQNAFTKTYRNIFDLSMAPRITAVKAKMSRGPAISSMFDIVFGLKDGR